jgi:hypothetical protein
LEFLQGLALSIFPFDTSIRRVTQNHSGSRRRGSKRVVLGELEGLTIFVGENALLEQILAQGAEERVDGGRFGITGQGTLPDDESLGVFVSRGFEVGTIEGQEILGLLQRLDWLEGIQAQQGEDTKHIQEKALSISGFRFGKAGSKRRLDIIELGLFGAHSEFEQTGFEVFDVGFVEAVIFGREEDRPFPEVLGALVAGETGRNGIAFANVERGKTAVIGIANEDIDASFLELRALSRLCEVGPFEVDPNPRPVGFFNDAKAIGVARGQEDFDRERSLMEVRHACRSSRSGYRMILGSRSTISKSR